MTSPVEWRPDGTPCAPRFDDIYRSTGNDGLGGLAQARHVFLSGCGLLPSVDAREAEQAATRDTPLWNGQAQWHVLETGFGLGLNFLATWAAWRSNPQRPTRLFFTSIEAWPVSSQDLIRSAQPFPELHALANELAEQWQAMLPGFHRMVFEEGSVQLTLCVGDVRPLLRELDVAVDSVFLDGFSPKANPEMWEPAVLNGIARLSRIGTRIATWTYARAVRDALKQSGFELLRRPGFPPKRDCLSAQYAPAWTPRHLQQLRSAHPAAAQAQRHAVVVGAGISGSSVAHSLATRGWQVTLLDTAPSHAAGASGLPAGLFAPHVSPDDSHLAQLTRAGVRSMRQRCERLLIREQDWSPTGVMELPVGRERRLPEAWQHAQQAGIAHAGLASSRTVTSTDATAWQADVAHLQAQGQLHSPPLWHAQAGWVRPAQLVLAQLQHPNIHWVRNAQVAAFSAHALPAHSTSTSLAPNTSPAALNQGTDAPVPVANASAAALSGSTETPTTQATPHPQPATQAVRWDVHNAADHVLASGDLLVLAAGAQTQNLLAQWVDASAFPTHAAQGLVTLGESPPAMANQPPVNGHGSHLRGIPAGEDGHHFWCSGASFLRDLPNGFDAPTVASEHAANTQRLLELLPSAGEQMAKQVAAKQVSHWHGTRCTVADRVPMIGPVQTTSVMHTPWVSTAMGARGLTLGVLSGELLAAWLHGEPLPLPHNLAHKLRASRFSNHPTDSKSTNKAKRSRKAGSAQATAGKSDA